MLVVSPLPFSFVSNSGAVATNPATNAMLDTPSLTWRATGTNFTAVIDLATVAVQYDTVALIGTNFRATDTVQIETGTTNTGTGSYSGTAFTTAAPPTGSTSKIIHRLGSVRNQRYLKISISGAGGGAHPDGFFEIQRVVVGKALPLGSLTGVDIDAQIGFVDQSVAYSGAGWEAFETYPVLPEWKVSISFIEASDFHTDWFPFFSQTGKWRGFLFVPQIDDPTKWQTEAVYGRIKSETTATVTSSNTKAMELTIRALAA